MGEKPTYEELEQRVDELVKEFIDHKFGKEALRESEEKYSYIFKNMLDGFAYHKVLLDENGIPIDYVFLKINDKFEEYTGLKCDDIIGKKVTEVIPGIVDAEPGLINIYGKVALTGESTQFELYFEPFDKHYSISSYSPQKGYFVSLFQDISERVLSENALRQSEERYRSLVDNINLGITLLDAGYNIIMTNTAVGRMLKKDVSEYIGKKCFMEFAKRDNICPECPGTQAMANREPQEIETVGVLEDGDNYPLWIRAFPTFGADGEVTGFIEVAANISRRKQIEEEKNKLEAKYQQAQKMEAVGTLAGGIAHDLNNLLQPILGYTQLFLMDKKRSYPEPDDLKEIEIAARKASELIQRLLTFSRKVESKFDTVDLNLKIEQVEKLLTRTIPKMIQIKLHLADNLKNIKADPVQIEQVIMNLAVNAMDAISDEGKLIIETKNITLDNEYCKNHMGLSAGEYALLIVSDTGHGIDEEMKKHIYEPFYSTKIPGKGTGLGLSMVYGIVKNHKGHINCYSEPGQGTTFNIYLPVTDDEVSLKKDEKEEKPKTGEETILLIDDEDFILNIGREIFTRHGYTVITASDGSTALEHYLKDMEKIDIIILDLNMPGMSGKRCLEGLLQLNPQAKIVIASGYTPYGTTNDVLDSGAKSFLSKPYQVNQALKVIRDVLDDNTREMFEL